MNDQREQYGFQVGDVDPTYDDGIEWCNVAIPRHSLSNSDDYWICTRPVAHRGPHVAHGGHGDVLGILYTSLPIDPDMRVSEGL